MDANHFDAFTRATARPRRVMVAGLLGLALTPLAPIVSPAKRKKGKKKKKTSACAASEIPCGQKGCCGADEQCVSGQCQAPAPPAPNSCEALNCSAFTNPAMPWTSCICATSIGGANRCFAVEMCGALALCDEESDCGNGYACQKSACGGNSHCVRTCG